MKHGQSTIDRARMARFFSGGIRFFLAAALTAARLGGGAAPFALGLVAASGAELEGLCALAGAAVGAVVFLEFSTGLAHIAVAILICTAAAAFRGVKIADRPLFAPLVCGGMELAVGGIYALQSLNPAGRLAACLTAAALAGISARCYAPLFGRGRAEEQPLSALFLGVTVLLAFGNFQIAGLSLGRAGVACVVLYGAWRQGAAGGAMCGVWAGLLTDLCAGDGGLVFSAVYGFAALAAGLRPRGGRIAPAGLWLLAALAVLAPVAAQSAGPALAEAGLAAGIFLLLPQRLLGGKRVQSEAPPSDGSAGPTLKVRLNKAAAAFRDLYDSLGRGTVQVTEENPAIIFDRAAERVCRGCALCDLCWKKEYGGTFNALNDATPFLLERGRALAKDFPNYFAARCIHLTDFLLSVNGELSAFLLRRQYRRQLEESRRSAKGQYAQLSDLLTATAANLDAAPAAGGAAPYAIGAALRPKRDETVCGDSVASFETETGLLCLLLSDGMGSGEAARRESALTCRLLRQFLEAGVGAEAALKTLNEALALRGQETGSFATIDLLTLRLADGEAALYKYGAAPSYVKRFAGVRRVTGSALPAGLRAGSGAPDVTRMTLEPESFVVLVSDGVADAGDDERLLNLLAGWDGTDPQALADLVLRQAVQDGGPEDDCGVQVLYLPAKNEKKV